MGYNIKKAFFGKKNRGLARKAIGAVKKRYVGKRGGIKTNQILQDVAMLKRALNVEKKRVDVADGVGVPLGLQATANDGAFKVSLNPPIPQGVTANTRNGNSVKFVSACLDFQVTQQVNAINAFRYRWFIVNRPDASQVCSPLDAHVQMFEPNLFTGFRDYHANRDPEYFHQFRILKKGTGYIGQDQLTAGVGIKQHKIPLKLNHHQKYNTDASLSTTKNQMYLIIVADTGDTNQSTGCIVKYAMRFYYVDN